MEVSPSKRQRLPMQLQLVQLPEDVVYHIMRHATVADIGQGRFVCRLWRSAIEEHSAELWEARIHALGLLPGDENDSVLGRAADRLRARIRDAKKKRLGRVVDQLYSQYFFSWQRHICSICKPADTASMRRCCTKPCNFRWIDFIAATHIYDLQDDEDIDFPQQFYENPENFRHCDLAGTYVADKTVPGMPRFDADAWQYHSEVYVRINDLAPFARELAYNMTRQAVE